jgi:6-phosphogluconolactonase (cycloisomerase 2 family)
MKFATVLLLSVLWLTSCQNAVNTSTSSVLVQARNNRLNRTPDRFLCALEPGNGGFTMLKVMDLNTRTIRSIFVPGQVLSLDGQQTERKIYLSSREGDEQPMFSLFEVDIASLQIQRVASFSQAGLWPSDFLVRQGTLYASGQRQNQNQLISLNLGAGGWQTIVQGFATGALEWGKTSDQVQSVAFDEEKITRTTIDIRQKRIVQIQTFNHGIPFGNNVGLASPDSNYFYALHQLQGEVEIYSFDITSGASNNLIQAEKASGILYNSVISRDGRHLYATIDNKIHRYELQGTQMRRLPPIELRIPEARYLTLSPNANILYVSHDRKNSVSQITLNPDNTYQVQEFAYPGQNNEVLVF